MLTIVGCVSFQFASQCTLQFCHSLPHDGIHYYSAVEGSLRLSRRLSFHVMSDLIDDAVRFLLIDALESFKHD